MTDTSPVRSLAAEILRRNIEAWRADVKPHLVSHIGGTRVGIAETLIHACTGHIWDCYCRRCLADWFIGHPNGQRGVVSFALCCDILDLTPRHILERLKLAAPKEKSRSGPGHPGPLPLRS